MSGRRRLISGGRLDLAPPVSPSGAKAISERDLMDTHIYKDFWEYDPAANTWTQKADFGGKHDRAPSVSPSGAKAISERDMMDTILQRLLGV